MCCWGLHQRIFLRECTISKSFNDIQLKPALGFFWNWNLVPTWRWCAQHSCDFCSKWQGWSPSAKAWLLLHRPWWLELGATKGWLHPARWQPINVAAHWLQPARPRLGTQVSCLAGAASQERKAWLNGLKMPWVQQLGLSSSYLEFQWIPFISHFHDWSLRHMWAGLRGMTRHLYQFILPQSFRQSAWSHETQVGWVVFLHWCPSLSAQTLPRVACDNVLCNGFLPGRLLLVAAMHVQQPSQSRQEATTQVGLMFWNLMLPSESIGLIVHTITHVKILHVCVYICIFYSWPYIYIYNAYMYILCICAYTYIYIVTTLIVVIIVLYSMLYYVTLYYITLYILYYSILYYIILYYIKLYYSVLYYIIVYYIILWYGMLSYMLLYYVVFYYIIVYHIIS